MNETILTLTGHVVTDVDHRTSSRGVHIASFRLASAARRAERDEALFVTVTCWRQLAENVAGSLAKGDPVVATGRLRVRSRDGEKGRLVWAELDAQTVGHDLSRGTAAFRHNTRAEELPASGEQEILDEMTVRLAEHNGDSPGDDPPAPPPAARAAPELPTAGSAPARADAA
jgi:single-strand DNA-binding protein